MKRRYKVICFDVLCTSRSVPSTHNHNDESVEMKLITTRKRRQDRSLCVRLYSACAFCEHASKFPFNAFALLASWYGPTLVQRQNIYQATSQQQKRQETNGYISSLRHCFSYPLKLPLTSADLYKRRTHDRSSVARHKHFVNKACGLITISPRLLRADFEVSQFEENRFYL